MAEIFHLPVDDLPPGWMPLEVIAAVKCLSPDNPVPRLVILTTQRLTPWEMSGMARLAMAFAEEEYITILNQEGRGWVRCGHGAGQVPARAWDRP